MTDLVFSHQNIVDLADKISSLQPSLNATERQLLLAIFAAAAERAKLSTTGGPSTIPLAELKSEPPGMRAGQPVTPDVLKQQAATPQSLKQQLLDAYIPGNDFNILAQVQNKITGDQLTG
jgi:hypothetical protein